MKISWLHKTHQGNSILIFLALLCFCVVPSYAVEEALTVAVASSLYPVMQQQVREFEQTHAVHVRLISGSTGRLYNQIIQGAPFDVFIAADSVRPKLLEKRGKVWEQRLIAEGYLGVLLDGHPVSDLARLRESAVARIVVPNPDVAPLGRMSKLLMQRQGLWHLLKPKIVYAHNALQARMMVDKGIVDAGFVVVPEAGDALTVIRYHAVVLSDTVLARQWLDMFSGQHPVLQAGLLLP